jgi:hypothetical protein
MKKNNMKNLNTFEEFLNESELNEAKLHPVNAEYVKQIDSWIEGIQNQLKNWPSGNKGADAAKREGVKELRKERAAIVKSGEVQYEYEPSYPSISY